MEKPAYFNFATDVVDRWAADPARLALFWVDEKGEQEERWTFAQVRDASDKLAGYLQRQGLMPGQRVLVLVGREPGWWISMIALLRAGLVAVPGTTLLTPKDIRFRLDAARAEAVIASPSLAERVDEAVGSVRSLRAAVVTKGSRPNWQGLADVLQKDVAATPVQTAADEPCLLYFTSGTTGPPKLVLHSHVSYPLGHVVTGRDWIGLKEGDLHWNLSDTGWAKAAWSSLFGPWNEGATVFVQDPGPKFDAHKMLETLRKFPITTLCAPPTIYRQLVRLNLEGIGLEKLRQVVAAGEPLNPEVIELWKKATGITIRDGFGQTETTILLGNAPGAEVKPGSMGRPMPGFEIEVIDDNLQPVGPGVEGEIAVRVKPNRPIGLFLGYENNPEENAAKFRGDYYLTGDRGMRDQDGYFWFVGRNDDVILSGGYRIGPFEVESALIEHPAVQEAAVVGSPDPDRYQIVKAFVVLCAGWKASPELARELQEHVKKVTAPYKYPREVDFVESLPKTISGKIRRAELREREAQRRSGAAH